MKQIIIPYEEYQDLKQQLDNVIDVLKSLYESRSLGKEKEYVEHLNKRYKWGYWWECEEGVDKK